MATKSYGHSKVFEVMKNTKEGITDNLTSLQYLQTLDFFLWNALESIAIECPGLFANYMAKVTARQSLKSSAKLTSGDRHKMPIQLFNVLMAKSPARAFDMSKALFINRGILFGFISLFCNKLRYYSDLQRGHFNFSSPERNTLIHSIEAYMGTRPSGNLYGALLQAQYWDTKARAFKALIVEKYTRMAVLQAQNTYKDFNHSVELDDVVQVYLVVMARAIDRCDARQGVLTTFIQNWFKSARGEVAKMAKGQTDSSYEEMVEAHGDAAHTVLGTTLPNVDREVQEHLSWVAKNVDPQGIVRTCLGIPEFFSRKQKDLLLEFAV